jgi:hypothetical protein
MLVGGHRGLRGESDKVGEDVSARTLIVELSGSGHRFYYVRLIAERALARGHHVTVLTNDSLRTGELLALHLGRIRTALEVIALENPTWRDVERVARDLDATVTIVPEADGHLVSLVGRGGWRGPGRLSLQVMRASAVRAAGFLRWVAASVVKTAAMIVLRAVPKVDVHVLRSGLWRGRSLWRPSLDPVGFVAGPDDVTRIRAEWDLDPGRTWFGVLGSVTVNKHVPLVADALVRLGDGSRYGLLVAGQVAPQVVPEIPLVRERLERAGCEFRIVDRSLDDVELDAAMAAIDCLVLAYKHLGPSGTFAKALAAGTRVLAAGSPTLKRDCAGAPDATEWTPMDDRSIAAGMSRARAAGRPEARQIATEDEFAAALLGE